MTPSLKKRKPLRDMHVMAVVGYKNDGGDYGSGKEFIEQR